jgi:hypothetical protein
VGGYRLVWLRRGFAERGVYGPNAALRPRCHRLAFTSRRSHRGVGVEREAVGHCDEATLPRWGGKLGHGLLSCLLLQLLVLVIRPGGVELGPVLLKPA